MKSSDRVLMGININCKKIDWLRMIFEGAKTIETRKMHSLRPYLGQRVGLIRTGKGKATLVGWATISEEVLYDSVEAFRDAENDHQVSAGGPFDILPGGVKYGYKLIDVVSCDPVPVSSRGIVARKIA